MTLNGVMAVILRYFCEFGYLPGVLRKSSRSLSHLLMSSCNYSKHAVETGFPSSHQLKSYVASKSRLKLAARTVLSADAGLLVLSLTVEALQGKMCQNSLPSGVGRSLGAKISGGRGRPWGIYLEN